MQTAVMLAFGLVVSGCMHLSERRTNRDVPVETVPITRVKPKADLRLSWADDANLVVQATALDACTVQSKHVFDRTVVVDSSVENFKAQMVATGVVAGIFGGTALILASSSKTKDDPATPDDEEFDPHPAAVGMGWTAAGVVAFSAIWAAVVASGSGVHEEHLGHVETLDAPMQPTLCNEKPASGEKLTVKARGFNDTKVVAAGATDAQGQLRIDTRAFDFLIAEPFRFAPELLASVEGQRFSYQLTLRQDVFAGFDARLRLREAEEDRRDAAEEKTRERDAQKERAAARARGDCEFTGENGVECELRLCAKIAAKVRTMEPDFNCNGGEPLDSYRSDWGQALRTIDNYLGVVRSQGDMRSFWRIQQQVERCKTPVWFRSCSN